MEKSQLVQNQVHTICRTCLENLLEGNEYNIFLIPNLAKWLSVCTSLVIEEDDEYPKYLCNVCYQKIQDFYEFREMCVNSMRKFENIKVTLRENSLNTGNIKCNQADVHTSSPEIDKQLEDHKDLLSKNKREIVDNSETVPKTKDSESDDDHVDFILSMEQSDETRSDSDYVENQSDLKNHSKKLNTIIKKQREFLTCDNCNKRFYSKVKYDAHMRVHAGQKAWECTVCNKNYQRYYSLRDHINNIHGPQENRTIFTCTYEGCDKSYKYKESLRTHIKQTHSGNEVNKNKEQYVCEECGRIMSNIGSLRRHRMMHSGDYPYKCNICSRSYIEKNKLDEHIRRHNGIKNYVCSICGLKKISQRDLNVHMNFHTKKKLAKCKYCPYTSGNTGNVKRHENIVHRGIKAYECKYCGNCFGKSETLKLHERTHTGEKPYECKICSKRFTQRTPLKMHVRRHEKDSTVGTTSSSRDHNKQK